MQQIESSMESDRAERKRVKAVVKTLAAVRSKGETLAEVAHDARNMVTALGLYCDLLEEPGVLDAPFLHYGSELRLVAVASRRLVEKLMAIDQSSTTGSDSLNGSIGVLRGRDTLRAPGNVGVGISNPSDVELFPVRAIESFAGELVANRNLLASLVGPSISLTVDVEGGALPVRMTGEELTRVLVNLVKNAAESMSAGGCITLNLHEFHAGPGAAPWLVLTVEDNGPGIPHAALKEVFEAGYTTHSNGRCGKLEWPGAHRGLGLSITRSILAAGGGSICAANRDSGGGRFVIELPVRTR
jgi:signal transduction histidine kinase